MKQKGIDSIALMLELTKDDTRRGAYGLVRGYHLCVQELSAVNQYLLRLPAASAMEHSVQLQEFLARHMGQTPALLWAEYKQNCVEARFMQMSPTMDAVGIRDFADALTALLWEQGFTACCMDCAAGEPLSVCGIDGGYRVLCPACFDVWHRQRPTQAEAVHKSGLPGILLGALPGLLATVLLLCLAIFPAPAGVLVGILAARGCQKRRQNPLHKAEVRLIIGCCAVLMLLVFWLGLGAQVYITFSPYYYITFWDALRSVPGGVVGDLLWLDGLVGLFSGLVLMAVSVLLTAKSGARHVRPVAEAVHLQ